MRIEDGTGSGNIAKVDASNRVHTLAITVSDEEASVIRGDAYNINSGLVTNTGVTEEAVLYLKNNEARDLHVTAIAVIMGPSTNGVSTDTCRIRVIKNPSAGTMVSEATAADTVSNRNFGTSKTLTADVYKGDDTSVFSDGTVHIESLISPGNRVFFAIDEVLTKGDSIGVTIEPSDSNTSMKTMCALVCHLVDPNQ